MKLRFWEKKKNDPVKLEDKPGFATSDQLSRDLKKELLPMLKEKAYKKGEFTLSSGKTSEHYVNCKPVTLSGEGLTLASIHMLMYIDTDYVAGLTLGADPLVSAVTVISRSYRSPHINFNKMDGLIVRKEPKGHGTQAWIEGPLPPEGTKITVLEDVITTGGSAIKAVEKLRDAGYVVNRVVSIIDRQEDGEADAAMKQADLELISIFKLDDLIYENE